MTNANGKGEHFVPNHIGTQSRGFGGNKGKKMQDTSGKHAQVIQTKGGRLLLCISTGRATLADSINRLKPPKENHRKMDKRSASTGKDTQTRQIA